MRVTVEYVKSLNAKPDVSKFAIKAAERQKPTKRKLCEFVPPHNFRNIHCYITSEVSLKLFQFPPIS